MQRYLALAVILGLLLTAGCFHDKPAPPPTLPDINATINATPPAPPPGIIITGQRNYSVVIPGGPVNPPPPAPTGYQYSPDESVAIYFIDVGTALGQGDAIFLKKGDLDMLVDAGPTEEGVTVRNFLKEHNVDDIDVWVSTHADVEHYGGMEEVAKEFRVEEVWWPGNAFDDSTYSALLSDLQQKGARLRQVEQGQTFDVNGIQAEVLNPQSSDRYNEVDNDGIVLRLTDRNLCVLLTADIQAGPQGELANMPGIECIIMQAPYHGLGRGYARMDLMMLHIRPRAMIISGGPNELIGGERQPLINRLNLRDIEYYENYRNGTVRITSDGIDYVIDFLDSRGENGG